MTTTQEALKFYADPNNWVSPSTGFAAQYDPEPSPIQKDRGTKAKEALEQGDRVYTNTNHGFNLKDRHFYVNANESIADENFDFDATLFVQGDFGNVDDKKQYAQMICNALNAQREALEQANKEGIVIGGWKLTYAGDEWVSREVYENLKRKVEALEQQDCQDCEKLIDDMNVLAKDLCACEDKLKALEQQCSDNSSVHETRTNKNNEQEQEPASYMWERKNGVVSKIPLYTHPTKNEASSLRALSDDEIETLIPNTTAFKRYISVEECIEFARAIEAKIRGE